MQQGNKTNAFGFDASEFQAIINWFLAAKDGKSIAGIRSTYGHTILDAMFKRNWQQSQKAGFRIWAYHYAVPGASPAQTQVAFMLDALHSVGGYKAGYLPPALDLEEDDGLTDVELRDWAVAFCEDLDAAINNPFQRTMIYSYQSFIDAHPLTFAALADRLLWFPALGTNQPADVGPFKQWAVWQYSDTGSIAGIRTPVDLDEWHTGLADLSKGIQQPPKLTPEVTTLQAHVAQLSDEVAAKDKTIKSLQDVVARVQADVKGE